MNEKEYIINLKKAIEEKRSFNIKFYILDEKVEKNILSTVRELFKFYDKDEYTDMIYTCVKELVSNAVKANVRKILFKINNLQIEDKKDFAKGLAIFESFIDKSVYLEHLKDLKKKNYFVTVRFSHNEHGVRIKVINSVKITKLEDNQLREKLKNAMKAENIYQFHLDQQDQDEGSDINIAMVVMLIKGLNFDPSLFRMGNDPNNHAIGRIELPFDEHFESVRYQNPKDLIL